MNDRTFTFDDQRRFAELSGDRNPLHLDEAWASTVFPGAVLVHGIHALLWGLEAIWSGEILSSLSVTFIKPILLGDTVTASRNADVLTLAVRGQPMVVARLGLEGAAANCPADAAGNVEAGDLGDYAGHHGIIAPLRNNMAAAAAFPTLVNALGIDRLNGLMNLSYLVGMECPGLDGIFSAFSIVFSKLEPPLTYRVIVFDDRFSRVTMAVEGAGLSGTVSAIAGRPEPPALPDQEIFDLVERSAFAGQQPLVIGGSSGLGAITVLLLAAGGARPTLTYRGSGKAARDLAARIEALGGACDLLQFDAADPARGLEMLSSGQWRGQEIYYFATPRIFRRRIEPFQHDDFREFFEIYVNGLYELMRGLMRHRSQDPLTLFYPSSVAVETRPTDLFEYALAKDAGERLCRLLERRYKRLSVIVERLPRIVTRQTQTFVQASGLAAHEVMIPIIRRMQQKR